MSFEWDEEKNKANIAKHGVRFEDAVTIFDSFTLDRIDDREDYGEVREISLGLFEGIAVLVVVHTDRDGNRRIISARPANRKERRDYDEAIQKAFNS